MLIDHWPLLGLRVTTPRLELRLPTDEELADLADVAAEGVHPPGRMPFVVPWTDLPPAERARSVVQFHWRQLASWTPESWSLNLAVFEDGRIVGSQNVGARDFAALREVSSGSWLGLRYHGRGVGTEMRAAVLGLAFTGLGAEQATSASFSDNPSSLGVSTRLGYERDGIERLVVQGRVTTTHRLRLTRAQWETHRKTEVSISGLEPCLAQFGLS